MMPEALMNEIYAKLREIENKIDIFNRNIDALAGQEDNKILRDNIATSMADLKAALPGK